MREDDYLFSKKLRDLMEPFKDLSPEEALACPEWWKALLNHAGIDKDEIDELTRINSSLHMVEDKDRKDKRNNEDK